MKRLWVVFSSLIVVSTFGFSSVLHGETISIEQEIIIQSRVLNTQSMIVDDSDRIIEVVSNTSVDVVPRVYRGSIASANELPLTDQYLEQYRRIVPEGTSTPGRRAIYYTSLFDIEQRANSPVVSERSMRATLLSLL